MLLQKLDKELVDSRYGWLFLLEYIEDEERQADFASKEAYSPVLETTASFTNGAILIEI